ncbi:MAG: RagB/SusD family nutrient uptake outer membrane protein [Alistipes putredinis]|nr:MAG: RagB/SusD family nutrient uptake outer membrane protein [Alistipes putredinis]
MRGGNNADLTVLRKYIGNESLRTDENTLRFVTMPKVFRIAEMYLIDAEAQYMNGGTGIEPLNALRKARGLAEIIASDENMFTEIQNERVREMIAEGGRLADLKRWKQGFQRDVQDSPDILVASSATATMAKEAGDFMFVWPIPNSEVSVNPNLTDEQNEGWN